MIDITPIHLETVKRILAGHVPDCEVRAFGSRVTRNAKNYSDLDLAVVGDRALNPDTLRRLKEAFEESDLPFRVDVLDWHAIARSFCPVIEKKFEVIQSGSEKSRGAAGEWRELKVGEIAAPVRNALVGGPFGSNLVSRDYVPYGVPVIRGQNMGARWVAGEFAFVSDAKAESLDANIARPGDIVFTQRGTLGQVSIVPEGAYERYLVSQSQMKLTVNPELADALFLYYVFSTIEQQDYIRQNAIQTGVPHTNLGIWRGTPVPLPPLPDQRAIAHILGTLDDKIELNRRMNGTLEAMARALFKSWFVDFDPVRAKAEGRDPGLPKPLANLFPDSFEDSELGEIPKGWRAVPLYDIATYINGAAYAAFDPNDERRGLPIIKIAELKAGVTSQTKFSDVQMPGKYQITRGDILFSWSGNPDTSIDTFVWSHDPAWLNQHIFRVVPHYRYERAFVLTLLKQLRPVFAEIARNKQTTGLGHVTVADMKLLLVVHPDDKVMLAWDAIAASILDRAFLNDVEIGSMTILRDTLLPKLISGELRVKDAERFIGEATA
jgi:type I restriction enzyme S subunit